MRTQVLVLAIAMLLVLMLASPVAAITNGQPDNGNHPYVVLAVFDDAPGHPAWRCSASLLSPTVVLTAAHCTDGAVAARIWLSAGPVPYGTWDSTKNPTCGTATGYPCKGDAEGVPHANPMYNVGNPLNSNGLPGFSYRDQGVIVLTTAVSVPRYAKLPTVGLVDTLKNKTAVDLVGYGVSEQIMLYPGQSPRSRWTGPRERLYAPSELVSGNFVHSAEYLRLALNPGGGSGGTCFGDSGGPDLLGGTDTVLGVNSYVTNVNCSGVGYSARVDIPQVLNWVKSFMP